MRGITGLKGERGRNEGERGTKGMEEICLGAKEWKGGTNPQ